MTDDLIALIIRETGWSLEYIRKQPLSYLYVLAEEFQYRRAVEAYQHAYDSALVVCTLASTRTRHYKPEDIIGEPPKRGDMTKKLNKNPGIYKVTLADGKEYDLPILNLNVLADLEEEFGCGLEEISNLLQTKQASSLRKTLYILLHRNYKDITQDKIGDLVDMENLTDVATSVAKALSGE